MFFANPILLYALALGLIPIIIYYLLRFRSLSVTWGANYVLEKALERLKNRLNLDQIILLTLRVLVCAFVVLAFARPILRSANAVAEGTGVHHVIVLDGSYSMLAGPDGHRRFDASIDALKKLVATWGRGESWSLLFLADPPRWVVDDRAIASTQEAVTLIEGLHPSECVSSLDAALAQVAQKFPRGKAEIFIFADDQAATWEGADRVKLPAELDAQIYWLNPSGEPRPNLAVIAVQTGADRVLIDNPCVITASIKNFSAVKTEDIHVELLMDGSFSARQNVSLLPNQTSQIHFNIKFTTPGSHSLCVQLSEDAIDFDNRMFAAVDVAEQLNVVELRDAGRVGKFDSSWGAIETLERARQLGAKENGSEAARGQIVWKLNEGDCNSATLADVDAVLLDGGRKLTPELAATLQTFVQSGGGLFLVADTGIDAASWNRLLGDAGLLPADLGALRTQPLGSDRFRSLARSTLADSPVNIFVNDAAGDITHARFYSYYETENPRPDATTIVRFDDQKPWAIRERTNAGRVLLITTGLAGQGNNLLVREFFLPLVYQLVQDASAGRIFPRTIARGEPIRLRISNPNQITGATFNRQGDDARPLPLRTSGGTTIAEVMEASLESGLYSMLTLAGAGAEGKRTWFAVQGPRSDSNLTPLSPAQLASINEHLNLTSINNWDQLQQAMQKQQSGHEWQSWAALGALLSLVVEACFQRRFSPEPRQPRRHAPQDVQPT